jgi:hypothetical protein
MSRALIALEVHVQAEVPEAVEAARVVLGVA